MENKHSQMVAGNTDGQFEVERVPLLLCEIGISGEWSRSAKLAAKHKHYKMIDSKFKGQN